MSRSIEQIYEMKMGLLKDNIQSKAQKEKARINFSVRNNFKQYTQNTLTSKPYTGKINLSKYINLISVSNSSFGNKNYSFKYNSYLGVDEKKLEPYAAQKTNLDKLKTNYCLASSNNNAQNSSKYSQGIKLFANKNIDQKIRNKILELQKITNIEDLVIDKEDTQREHEISRDNTQRMPKTSRNSETINNKMKSKFNLNILSLKKNINNHKKNSSILTMQNKLKIQSTIKELKKFKFSNNDYKKKITLKKETYCNTFLDISYEKDKIIENPQPPPGPVTINISP